MIITLMKNIFLIFTGLFLIFTGACTDFRHVPINTNTPTPIPADPTIPVVPSHTPLRPSATPACRQLPGEVSLQKIQSSILKKPFSFLVYLPPCYAQNTGEEFSVIYLLHGQTYDQNQWVRLGAVRISDALIASSPETRPFLLVMPLEENDLADPYETRFGEALAMELVPWIDEQYHTCTQRTCRAIAGISRGGAWAVWTGFHYPQLFSVIGGHSFPPFTGDLYRLPTWLREIPGEHMPVIYLDSGSDDPWLPDTRRFVEVLEQFHVPVTFTINPGDHSEMYWHVHMQEYISQLAVYISR